MKIVAALLMCLFLSVPSGLAQSTSVWLEDLTPPEIEAAVKAGKSTVIFYGAGFHQSGPAVALGKHVFLARYCAQRLAEALGNALLLPIQPLAPAEPGGDPYKKEGHMRSAGTLSITDETWGNVVRETIISAIVSAGFKNVVILGDHGRGQDTKGVYDGGQLKKVAEQLDAEWKPKGTRAYYVPLYMEVDHGQMKEYLTTKGVPENRHTAVDDHSELMAIERDHAWIRQDKIPADIRNVASAETGRVILDLKLKKGIEDIRKLIPAK